MKRLFAIALVLLASCNKPTSKPSSLSALPSQTDSFHQLSYRSIDDQQAITLNSSDELELRTNGVNLICKYTKQDDQLRVVANVMGTTQALYYTITPDGLRDNEGKLLLSPDAYSTALNRLNEARRAEADRATQQAAEIADSTRQTTILKTYSFPALPNCDSPWQAQTRSIKITDVSVLASFYDNLGHPPDDAELLFRNFAEIDAIHEDSYGQSDKCYYVLIEIRDGYSIGAEGGFTCKDRKTAEEIRKEIIKAYTAWHTKYPNSSIKPVKIP